MLLQSINIRTKAFAFIAFVASSCALHAQTPAFARGADVSWCTEMEADGKKFYNANGQETEIMALMKQIGMNSVRLRVWVNPENNYGAWSDKADVLVKAKRAQAQGLAIMIDFHYSDFFADPGRQDKPAAWTSLSMADLKKAVTSHTVDILNALKAEGVSPLWVQVGNETRSGMIWDSGKIDWSKSGSAAWANYIALSNAGYDAVKSVMPQAKVIVHIDKGPDDNAWFFKAFKQYGGKFDMIGLSHYPESDWKNENAKTIANIKSLATQFGVPVMIVETGYNASNESLAAQVMNDLMTKAKASAQCAGVFYWEPEVYGWWKPAYYTKLGWNAYNKGAFTSQGRPSAALAPFFDPADGISKMQAGTEGHTEAIFNLAGQKTTSLKRGVAIEYGNGRARKVLRR